MTRDLLATAKSLANFFFKYVNVCDNFEIRHIALLFISNVMVKLVKYYFIATLASLVNRYSDKKLSCRRETARRFLSLNIMSSHSSSLKVIRNDTVE